MKEPMGCSNYEDLQHLQGFINEGNTDNALGNDGIIGGEVRPSYVTINNRCSQMHPDYNKMFFIYSSR